MDRLSFPLLKRWTSLALGAGVLIGCDRSSPSPAERDAGVVVHSKDESGRLPFLGTVPEFSFTSQEGKPFGSAELRGQPYLAAFMFTRCPSICPRLTAKMKEVDLAVKREEKRLSLLSVSVDPDNDTPDVLRAYAEKHGANQKNWSFVTGEYESIARTAEESFKLALSGTIDESKPHLGITHGSHLVLVDASGNLRAYFRSSEEETASAVVQALDRL